MAASKKGNDDDDASLAPRVWEKAAALIRRNGIPQYVERWRYAASNGDPPIDMADVAGRVREYHHHTSIADSDGVLVSPKEEARATVLSVEDVERPTTTKRPTVRERERLLRRPTEFAYDAENGVGTVTFFAFVGIFLTHEEFQKKMVSFALTLRKQLGAWEKRRGGGLRGLILDFRLHHGGSFWPILFGMAPYLSGLALFAWHRSAEVPRPNEKVWITLDDVTPATPEGIIRHGPNTRWRVPARGEPSPRNGHHGDIPIALLLGRETYSSGELAAAMFQGRDNVRSFGEKTGGGTSVNGTFGLPGGYDLVLTQELVALADGTVLTDELLVPDRTVKPGIDSLCVAKAWVNDSMSRQASVKIRKL